MNKSWVLLLLLNACLLANAWAKDEGGANAIGDSLKKAGNSAGSLLEKGGKAVAPEVHKGESWLGSTLKSGSKKSDKADK